MFMLQSLLWFGFITFSCDYAISVGMVVCYAFDTYFDLSHHFKLFCCRSWIAMIQ